MFRIVCLVGVWQLPNTD